MSKSDLFEDIDILLKLCYIYLKVKKGGSMSFPEEKRQYQRFEVKLPVRYQIMCTENFANTLTCDISAGGLRVLTEEFIAPETKLVLEINFVNSSHVINTSGKVIWSQSVPHTDRYESGISFLEMTQNDQEDVLECLNRLQS